MKRIFAIVLALMLALPGCCALAEGTLNVTGSGTVYMEADLVSTSLGVNLSGEDLERLQQEANDIITAICEALVEAGLDEEDISTNYLHISPRYDYSGEMVAIMGYNISNSLTIRTSEIDKIGVYIDAAFAAGANSFDSINFTVEDDSAARREALALAVQDAAAKAEVIAAAAGHGLGGIISISEGSGSDYSWSNSTSGSVMRYEPEAMKADSAAGIGSTVRAAQVQVSAAVQLAYELI